jgi:predicted peptidase
VDPVDEEALTGCGRSEGSIEWFSGEIEMKCLSVVFLLLATPGAQDGGEARQYAGTGGKKLLYRLFKPAGGDGKEKVPLVLFLHGAGERGDDNQAQLKNGVKAFLDAQSRYPSFVVVPQCPQKAQWVDTPWGALKHTLPAQPSEPLGLVIDLLASLEREFPSIDPHRLYVTGLSMGGFGTWDLITRLPRKFAAAVPVCGGADETRASMLAKIPLWVFHGGADDVVKTVRSRNIVAAIKAAGGSPRYTEYPGVGHACWDQAYGDPGLFPWLFSQKLP